MAKGYPPDTVFGKVMAQLEAFDRTLSARAVGTEREKKEKKK